MQTLKILLASVAGLDAAAATFERAVYNIDCDDADAVNRLKMHRRFLAARLDEIRALARKITAGFDTQKETVSEPKAASIAAPSEATASVELTLATA